MARASMLARDLRSCVTSRSVGRSKASNLLFGVLTKRHKHPGLRKVVTLRGGAVERGSWPAPASYEERLQPLLGLGVWRHRVLGISRGGEHALLRFIGAPMTERGSFTQGLPAHAAPRSNSMSSPLLPAGQTIGLLPAPKGTARRPRGTVRRRTADGMALQLFDARRKSRIELSKRGQGRQPRTEEDRRLAGVPACRNRVAEIGSRNRGSEKRIVGPLLNKPAVDVVRCVGGS